MINGYIKLAEGAHCEVWLHENHIALVKSAPAEALARLRNVLEWLTRDGPENLNKKQFAPEGRHKVAKGRVMLFAIKGYQLRLYGGWLDEEPRIFLCPEAAIKQKNKADNEQLQRVARKLGEIKWP